MLEWNSISGSVKLMYCLSALKIIEPNSLQNDVSISVKIEHLAEFLLNYSSFHCVKNKIWIWMIDQIQMVNTIIFISYKLEQSAPEVTQSCHNILP